jgi:hypothetical protein
MPIFLIHAAILSVAFQPGDSISVYTRPDFSSTIFGTLLPGESVELTVITLNGWLGFDPGTAQATATESFRYRWLPPGSAPVDTTGLERVWAPAAGITCAIAVADTPVHSSADTSSAALFTLEAGTAAEVVEQNSNWLRITGGSEGVSGWVMLRDISLSED